MPTTVAQPAQSFEPTPWLKTLIARYTSKENHAFLLHGNKDDHVVSDFNTVEYLCHVTSATFPTRVKYSPGSGFTFPDKESCDAFLAWLAKQGQPGITEKDLTEVSALSAIPTILRFLASAPQHSAVVIVDQLHLILPNDRVTSSTSAEVTAVLDLLPKAGRNKAIAASKNILILLTPTLNEVHKDIRAGSSGIFAIEIPLPDKTTRQNYIHDRIRFKDGMIHDQPIIKLAISEAALAEATAGLTLQNVEDLLLRGSKLGSVTRDIAQAISAELIAAEADGLIKIVKPERGFDGLGGLTEYKEWATECLIEPAHSDDPEQRASMPMVVITPGPPGTGKTEGVYATGFELGWNIIEYEQIKDSLVGATERNDAQAERIIRNRLPALLFLDEAETMFGRVTGGTGSGGESVDKAIFRNRLRLFNDKSLRGRLVIFLATNVPQDLDGAVIDRADYVIPFLPVSTVPERAEIIGKILERVGVKVEQTDLCTVAGKLGDNWSNRDIAGMVTKAYGLMKRRGLSALEALQQSAASRRPAQRADTRTMTQHALAACNDLDLLPLKYRESVDQAVLEAGHAGLPSRADGEAREF